MTAEMWAAMKRVESDRGHTPSVFQVPAPTTRTLQPARRVHKIMKGVRLSERNREASAHVEAAKQWVAESNESIDARSSASAHIKTAKVLAKHLNIDLETARGVVTSLKRMQVL
jgi:hypothetical protein